MKTSDDQPHTDQIRRIVETGEGQGLEFKRTTAELQGAMQTLCAFMNGSGGTVIIGVGPDGRLTGQEVSDATQQKIAAALDRFEPPAPARMDLVNLEGGRTAILLNADADNDAAPFTYEGRAYERLGSTTHRMPQSRYEQLLLGRGHAKRRWENLPVEGVTLKDLDRKEILRTREMAIQQNRISPDTGRDVGDILDRLGLRVDGVLTQAAQVLYGKRLFPDYPQCLLKMGRFRGSTVIGDIVDNRQEHINAFAMVREGMAFLERTMPLGARFPTGQIFREDRFPVPLDALREILLNAVMHREYADYSGYVAIVVFDDRIEIQSHGLLPRGVTVEQLSGPHPSKLRNPLIAEAFHRTGAVEVWGRGTNRVLAMCREYGAPPPVFEERQGFLIVTFKAALVDNGIPGQSAHEGTQKSTRKSTQKTSDKILAILNENPSATMARMAEELGIHPSAVKKHLRNLKQQGRLKRIGPDKGGHWEVLN
jgi:ATP-dependent DNA helicase RecG